MYSLHLILHYENSSCCWLSILHDLGILSGFPCSVYRNGQNLEPARRLTLTNAQLRNWDSILFFITDKVNLTSACRKYVSPGQSPLYWILITSLSNHSIFAICLAPSIAMSYKTTWGGSLCLCLRGGLCWEMVTPHCSIAHVGTYDPLRSLSTTRRSFVMRARVMDSNTRYCHAQREDCSIHGWRHSVSINALIKPFML